MRRLTVLLAVLVLLGSPLPAHARPSPDVAYPDDPELQQAYEDGFTTGATRGEDQGYSSGRDQGYDDGYAAGLSDGEQKGRDEAIRQADETQLREGVEQEAQKTEEPEVVEGGEDVQPAPAVIEPAEAEGPGFPWWPLSFAVVATVWFVTRRRRLDAEDEAADD